MVSTLKMVLNSKSTDSLMIEINRSLGTIGEVFVSIKIRQIFRGKSLGLYFKSTGCSVSLII